MSSAKPKIVYSRNPIYVFYALGALLLLIFSAIASDVRIGPVEQALFNVLYFLPSWLEPAFLAVTVLGLLSTALIISLFFFLRKRSDIALRILIVSVASYGVAALLASVFDRGSPEVLIENVVTRISFTGFIAPSSYAAVSVAYGITLALYAPRSYRRWILLAIALIGCSRVYLGVSLPLDVVAGWSVGLLCYSLASLALGSKRNPVSSEKLEQKLTQGGLEGVKLKPASVDARGSVPFFGEYKGGKIFVKVFNQDNNAADWLFKLMRRIRYRRLEDEIPSLTPKRAIEHEAYLTMLAKYGAGVRVPQVLGIYHVETNSYAMATLRLSATGLDKFDKSKITEAMLDNVWAQIKKLHKNNIIHKDLRTANVMIEEKTGLPWLIDFGFSECAVDQHAYFKDNVEFIASSATKVGAVRAVEAGRRALGKNELNRALFYMRYANLSGATTTALKQSKTLLDQIRQEIIRL